MTNSTPALTTGVFLVLAVIAANAWFSYHAIHQLAFDQKQVVHCQEMKSELQATLATVTDAETTHRGYLLTGNPVFLAPFWQGSAQAFADVDRLQELAREDPGIKPQIPVLRRLIDEKLAMARSSLDSAEHGDMAAARASLSSGAGRQKMDQIRDLEAQMLEQESGLLDKRTRAAAQSLRDAVLTFAIASFVAVAFVVAFYVVARREVRERVKKARVIEDNEAWLNTTLSSIGDAVIATDASGTIQFVNRAAEKLIACTNQDCSGRPIGHVFRIFHEGNGDEAPNPVEKVLKDGSTGFSERIVLRNFQGEEIPIEDSAAPIVGHDGEVVGVVLVFRDLTSRRMAQESARRSEKLAATGRLAATIAHEINNPLEAATNFIYLAKSSESLEDARRYLGGADLELARAAHITRKALSFYRDSSRPVLTNIAALLEEVMAIYGGRVRSARVNVRIECSGDLELFTLRGELVQIVSNLVSNALDALPPGGLLVLRARKAQEGIVLEVEDNGEGIAAANMDKIFEAFFTTKKEFGTGLGLWVVHDLVQKQGGMISVESHTEGPQRGTRFSVFLPPVAANANAPQLPRKLAS